MRDDGLRWDERYRAATPTVPAPPEILAARPELEVYLPRAGRGVDIACGTGAVALWMAQRGLRVTALDASTVAIDLLRQAATAAGLADRIDALVVDLDDGLLTDPDGVDVIVCQRFHDPRIYPGILAQLRPGGVALVTVLSEVGCDDPGPFHAPAGELDGIFATDEVEVIHRDEGAGTASIVVRRR